MPFPIIWLLPITISIVLLFYATRNSELFIPMKRDEYELHKDVENLKDLLIEMTVNWKHAEERITQQQIVIEQLRNELDSFKFISNSNKVNILVIAVQNDDLDIDKELLSIFNSGIDYTVLSNNVTKSSILKELARNSYEIIHVISHADENGIHLSNDIAESGWWLRVKQQYRINLLFLNACKTLDIVDKFYDNSCAIGTTGDVKDVDAILFAKDFYNWFANGKTAKESFDLAKLSLSTKASRLVRITGDCDIHI